VADNTANIKINGDPSGFVKATNVAQGALGKLQTQLGALEVMSAKSFSASGIAGIGLSATAAAAALLGAVTSAADYGDALDNMAQRTGESVENLAKLQYAAKMSDTSTEALAKGLTYLSGQIVSASRGSAESSALFEKFGIAVRNTDGTVRGVSEVLGDFADVFANMPDGPEKTALAVDIFGKKLGAELIPMLNQGKDGLKALGDEAERFGLVINGEQAKAAAKFNDNLDRMAALARAASVSIGNVLLPVINQFMGKLLDAKQADLSIWQILGVLPKQGEDPATQLKQASAELDKLKAKRDALYKQNLSDGGSTDTTSTDAEVKAMESRVEYLKLQNKRLQGDDEDTTKKRLALGVNLASELAKLENLRAIAAGKASADILKDDKARTADQIKEAEKLRDALRSAWETSRKEAQVAADDATKLLEKAAGVRTSALDKATQIRESGLSPEEQQAANLARAQEAQGQGAYYAAAAGAAKLDGRTKEFEKYQKQAEAFLDRAQKFAEASGNADMVEQVGNDQAGLIEQQAKAKQAEAAALEKRATDQAATLATVEAKLTELQTKAAALEIKVKIDEALGNIANIQTKLDAMKDKTVTVTVNEVGSAAAIAAGNANKAAEVTNPTGFAGGGWTGFGGKFEPAGIVHRKEFVVNSERTAEPGALDFLWRFHRYGMRALKGYAGGGLVDSFPIPQLSSSIASSGLYGSQTTPLVLDFGKLGRINAEARRDSADEILRVFDRARLQFARRP